MNKCISGSTNIYIKTNDGFEKILVKDLMKRSLSDLYLWDGYKWVKINGFKQISTFGKRIELVLSDGERICCTDDYYWVLTSGWKKQTKDLSIGDKIKKVAGFPDAVATNNITDSQLTSLAYWFFRGSGTVRECNLLLQNINNEQRIIFDSLKDFNCENISYETIGSSTYVKFASRDYFDFVSKYIIGKLPKKRTLSKDFWELSNKQIRVFVNSVLSCVGANRNSNEFVLEKDSALVSDLRVAANRLGETFITKEKEDGIHCIWKPIPSTSLEISDIKEGKATFFYEISVESNDGVFSLSNGVLSYK